MDRSDDALDGLVPLELDPTGVPHPDRRAEPDGYVVLVGERDRIHFLDWGGPRGIDHPADVAAPGVLLVHGYASTAWSWAPVARRLCRIRHVVSMDLRGHGLSDAPVDGYDPATLAEDVVAVAEGAGLVDPAEGAGLVDPAVATGLSVATPDADPDRPPARRVVLAGHGFGAAVAAWAAASLGRRCAGLLLVDGGWEDARAATGLEPEDYLREDEEPPEILRSMRAFLADRRGFDPGSWDADQERAARASVVELPSGRVERAIHPHVRVATVEAMFAHRPLESLEAVEAPIAALVAGDDPDRYHRLETLGETLLAVRWSPVRVARFPDAGHNLMRYHPAAVAAAVLATTSEPT